MSPPAWLSVCTERSAGPREGQWPLVKAATQVNAMPLWFRTRLRPQGQRPEA